jgi:hypothetical protein
VPCVSKRERIDDSVASKLKLPTKIFAMVSLRLKVARRG